MYNKAYKHSKVESVFNPLFSLCSSFFKHLGSFCISQSLWFPSLVYFLLLDVLPKDV